MPEQTQAEKENQNRFVLGQMIGELMDLNSLNRDRVGYFIRAVKNHTGFTSPAEEFISQIVDTYGICGYLDPDDVEDEIKKFRENLADTIKIAQAVQKQYPELMKAESDETDGVAH